MGGLRFEYLSVIPVTATSCPLKSRRPKFKRTTTSLPARIDDALMAALERTHMEMISLQL
jgi:hypothetical protein